MTNSLGQKEFPGLTMNGGDLLGLPVITSENIPSTGGSPTDGDPIIVVSAPDILLADDGQVTIDASREASLQMDTAPDSPATASTIVLAVAAEPDRHSRRALHQLGQAPLDRGRLYLERQVLRVLVEQDSNGIWKEVDVAAFSPVLRKPNRYQNRIKFIEQWVVSKLLHGNTYVLKQRDNAASSSRCISSIRCA
jgi:hypothetical protein